jgi:hypothetical protein
MDIKPLFREEDQRSMLPKSDLWYEDVSARAGAIASFLRAGTMPCDGAWPQANIDLFDDWVAAGKLP